MGHSALMIGNDKTGWVYISKNGRNGESSEGSNNNSISGGPTLPSKPIPFNKLNDFLANKDYKNYQRIALFSFSSDPQKLNAAIIKMTNEANSDYNAYSSNCAEAVSNTFEAFGLKGGENYAALYSSTGSSTYIGPSSQFPVDPNSIYTNTIFNNPQKFLMEILR